MSFSTDFFVRKDNGSNIIEINPELIKNYPKSSDIDIEINRISSEYTDDFSCYNMRKLCNCFITYIGFIIGFTAMMACIYLIFITWHLRYLIDYFAYNEELSTKYYDPDEERNILTIFLEIYGGGIIAITIFLLIDLIFSIISFCFINKEIGDCLFYLLGCYELIVFLFCACSFLIFVCFLSVYEIFYTIYWLYDINNVDTHNDLSASGQAGTVVVIFISIFCCGCIYFICSVYPAKKISDHASSVLFATNKEFRDKMIRDIIEKERSKYVKEEIKKESENILNRRFFSTSPSIPPSSSGSSINTPYYKTETYHNAMQSQYNSERRRREMDSYNTSVQHHNQRVLYERSQGQNNNHLRSTRY